MMWLMLKCAIGSSRAVVTFPIETDLSTAVQQQGRDEARSPRGL